MTPLKLRIVAPARTDRRIASLLGAIEDEARLIGADVAVVSDISPVDEGDEIYLLVPEELFPRTALTVPALNARAGRLIGLVVMPHLSPRFLADVRQTSRCATAYALGEAEVAFLSSFHPDARRLRLGYSRAWDRYDDAAPRDTAFVYCGPPEAPIVTAVARAGQYLWRERARAHFVRTDDAAARPGGGRAVRHPGGLPAAPGPHQHSRPGPDRPPPDCHGRHQWGRSRHRPQDSARLGRARRELPRPAARQRGRPPARPGAHG